MNNETHHLKPGDLVVGIASMEGAIVELAVEEEIIGVASEMGGLSEEGPPYDIAGVGREMLELKGIVGIPLLLVWVEAEDVSI